MAESENTSEKQTASSRMFKTVSDLLIPLSTTLLIVFSLIKILEIIVLQKNFESNLHTTEFLILIGSVVFITLLNVGLGILGIRTEKNTTETKLLSIDKPILLTVKTDNTNLQKNIDILSHQKKAIKAGISSLENEISFVEEKFYKTNNQINECEEKSGQRVERAINKARNLQLAFVFALFSSAIFGTYLARLSLDLNSEYSTLISFLLVFLLDLGLVFIFANSLLILEIVKKYVPVLNIMLVFSLAVLSVLVVIYRSSADCLYCNYLFPLLHLNLGLVAGIFLYQYQTLSWATDLAKEKQKLEKRLEQLRREHTRSLTDVDILNDMLNSNQRKLKIQTVDLENPRF